MKTPALRLWSIATLLLALLTACSSTANALAPTPVDSSTSIQVLETPPTQADPASACQVTEPTWLKPPEDSAVLNPPEFGYYFVNPDRSIWASAWWAVEAEPYPRLNKEGEKVGWFRPEGAPLVITGRRIDGEAPPLEAEVPCCYSTRFQASGLYFPTEGCWEITAKASGSELSFVVWVEP
jgi:hypothetical protein